MEDRVIAVKWIMATEAAIGFLVAVWAKIPMLWQFLAFGLIINLVTGIIKAINSGNFSLHELVKGLLKKMGVVMLLGIVRIVEYYASMPDFAAGFCAVYALKEIASSIGNLESMGIWVPGTLKQIMAMQKQLEETRGKSRSANFAWRDRSEDDRDSTDTLNR